MGTAGVVYSLTAIVSTIAIRLQYWVQYEYSQYPPSPVLRQSEHANNVIYLFVSLTIVRRRSAFRGRASTSQKT
jgi:hypothetical protein